MSGSRFDSWTRRRVGTLAGGLAAALGGLVDLAPIDAKKKHKRKKKKRCRKLGTTCTPGGKRKCCKGVACTPTEAGVARCCRGFEEPCSADSDCCSSNCTEDGCGGIV